MSNIHVDRLRGMANILGCRAISDEILNDEKFALWSGSSKPTKHHYGKGKLAEHTCEVTEIALANNNYFEKTPGKSVNIIKLFLACLFHDMGKVWDYIPLDEDYKEWGNNSHRFKIHHISRSGLIWCGAALKHGWAEEDMDEVWHCILSHHNLKEWGSPVQPKTRMALLLHLADSTSARMDDCTKQPL